MPSDEGLQYSSEFLLFLENFKPDVTALGAVLRERITLAVSGGLPTVPGTSSTI